MLTVGLTGAIGSGKSTLCELLRTQGAEVLAADALGHDLLAPGRPAYHTVREWYGDEILLPDGTVDRRKLGRKVFGDSRELARYNALVHPLLTAALLERLERARDQRGVLVVDAALLYEWGLEDRFDLIILVSADPAVRLHRIQARDGLSRDDFNRRDAAQRGPQPGSRKPDFTITNNGDIHALQRQAEQFWQQFARNCCDA